MDKQNLNSDVPDEIVTEAEQAKVSQELGTKETKPDENLNSEKKDTSLPEKKIPGENKETAKKEPVKKKEIPEEQLLKDKILLARYKQQVEGSKKEMLKEKEKREKAEKRIKAFEKASGTTIEESLDQGGGNPEVEQGDQPLEQRISSLEKSAIAKKETEVSDIISTFRKENSISDEVYEVVIEPQLPAIKEMIDPATGKTYPLKKGLEIALIIGNREKLVTDAQAATLAKVKAQKGATKQSGAKTEQTKQKKEYSDDQQHVAEQMDTKLE